MSTVQEEKKVTTQCAPTQPKQHATNKFDGKIVSLTGNKLVMTSQEGKEYSHTLTNDAKVTCDGVACKADSLKAGSRIRVTTQEDNKNVATCIELIEKNTEFAHCAG